MHVSFQSFEDSGKYQARPSKISDSSAPPEVKHDPVAKVNMGSSSPLRVTEVLYDRFSAPSQISRTSETSAWKAGGLTLNSISSRWDSSGTSLIDMDMAGALRAFMGVNSSRGSRASPLDTAGSLHQQTKRNIQSLQPMQRHARTMSSHRRMSLESSMVAAASSGDTASLLIMGQRGGTGGGTLAIMKSGFQSNPIHHYSTGTSLNINNSPMAAAGLKTAHPLATQSSSPASNERMPSSLLLERGRQLALESSADVIDSTMGGWEAQDDGRRQLAWH